MDPEFQELSRKGKLGRTGTQYAIMVELILSAIVNYD